MPGPPTELPTLAAGCTKSRLYQHRSSSDDVDNDDDDEDNDHDDNDNDAVSRGPCTGDRKPMDSSTSIYMVKDDAMMVK